MKKIIKNIMLSFVIIFTILNLAFNAFSIISKYCMVNNILTEYTGENRNVLGSIEAEKNAKEYIQGLKNTYGEEAPVTQLAMLQNYTRGMNDIIYIQIIILIATVILSISIGIILSITERSKIKELLDFITGAVILILVGSTIDYIAGGYEEFKIFETIKTFGIYYIIAYIIKNVYLYWKSKKSIKELNKVLENKNK